MMKECLLCRRKDGVTSFNQPNQTSKNRKESDSQDFKLWGEKCTLSICRLFKIQKSHPFRHFFRNACYCQDCLQLMRDVDFTLRQLDNLQQQIIGFREDLMTKLESNYEKIPNLDSIKTGFEDINNPQRQQIKFSFDEAVKLIYEKADIDSESWTAVDFLRNNYKRISTRNSVNLCDIKQEIIEQVIEDENEHFEEQYFSKKSPEQELITPSKRLAAVNVDYSKLFDKESDEGNDDTLLQENYFETGDPDWSGKSSSNSEAESVDEPDEDVTKDETDGEKKPKKKRTRRRPRPVNQKKTFHCTEKSCGRGFDVESNLLAHIRKIHEGDPIPYHCTFCESKYHSREALRTHLMKHKTKSELKKFYCQESTCGRGFEKESALKSHTRKIHEGDPNPYHCELCELKYRSQDSLKFHMNRHNYPGKVWCIECNKGFKTEENLLAHKKKCHDPETKKQWSCSFCGINFKTEEEIGKHEEIHRSREIPFSCLICNQNSTSSLDLTKHMQSHDEKRLMCDTCGKRFASASNLRAHLKLHDESFTKFQCSECGLRCSSSSILERHKASHTNERNHICEKCGKSFKYGSALTLHSRRHDNVNPFKCKICGRGFIASHYLKKHEQIHSGLLSFECKICSKRFRAEPNLFQHSRIHQPKDPNKKPRIRIRKKTIFDSKNSGQFRAKSTRIKIKRSKSKQSADSSGEEIQEDTNIEYCKQESPTGSTFDDNFSNVDYLIITSSKST